MACCTPADNSTSHKLKSMQLLSDHALVFPLPTSGAPPSQSFDPMDAAPHVFMSFLIQFRPHGPPAPLALSHVPGTTAIQLLLPCFLLSGLKRLEENAQSTCWPPCTSPSFPRSPRYPAQGSPVFSAANACSLILMFTDDLVLGLRYRSNQKRTSPSSPQHTDSPQTPCPPCVITV